MFLATPLLNLIRVCMMELEEPISISDENEKVIYMVRVRE